MVTIKENKTPKKLQNNLQKKVDETRRLRKPAMTITMMTTRDTQRTCYEVAQLMAARARNEERETSLMLYDNNLLEFIAKRKEKNPLIYRNGVVTVKVPCTRSLPVISSPWC